jgi:hypothetical protein
MPFHFAAVGVRYDGGSPDDETTILTGHLVEGAIEGPESVLVPTASGATYRFWMTGLQAPGNPAGPAWPLRPGGGLIDLFLGGHPPEHDIAVPCTVVADGAEDPE